MAKIRTTVDCKCGFSEKIICSRPNATSRATGRTSCSTCFSQILYEVKAGDGKTVQVRNMMLTISPDLQAMLDENSKDSVSESEPLHG